MVSSNTFSTIRLNTCLRIRFRRKYIQPYLKQYGYPYGFVEYIFNHMANLSTIWLTIWFRRIHISTVYLIIWLKYVWKYIRRNHMINLVNHVVQPYMVTSILLISVSRSIWFKVKMWNIKVKGQRLRSTTDTTCLNLLVTVRTVEIHIWTTVTKCFSLPRLAQTTCLLHSAIITFNFRREIA